MNPGSIFFDEEFAFQNGGTGEKLFVVLGSEDRRSIVAKTTSQQRGRGTEYGCQPKDRFPNFYLPDRCCHLKGQSWVCLDEFYELDGGKMLQKRFSGLIKPVCTIPDHLKKLQECALNSADISPAQAKVIRASLS